MPVHVLEPGPGPAVGACSAGNFLAAVGDRAKLQGVEYPLPKKGAQRLAADTFDDHAEE
jgi:hypothetical protein